MARSQTLDEAYAEPSNFLEIDVKDAQTHGFGKVRRRYSDFDWLRAELERDSKILVPPLPGKAVARQLPWLKEEEGMFAPDFIEERRAGLEVFVNKIAGHPLAQKEKCLHMFLQEAQIDKAYIPGKVDPRHK